MAGASLSEVQMEQLRATLAEARAAGQRRGVVVEGGAEQVRARTARAIAILALPEVGWVSEWAPPGGRRWAPARARAALGQEVGSLVLDLHGPVDPDGLGAAVGAARGGGLVFFLCPPLESWRRLHASLSRRLAPSPWSPAEVGDRYLRRLAGLLGGAPGFTRLRADGSAQRRALCPAPAPAPCEDPLCRTLDQRRAVDAVLRAARGRARRPVVLTADRGRGKSSALGLAAGALLAEGHSVLLTAPRLEAARPVLRHAAARLGLPSPPGGRLRAGTAELRYLPPGELIDQLPEARLLLVDEAAALPVALLRRLLARYPRVAFATTEHGYEGTGRGFQLRFRAHLDAQTPGWRAVQLSAPIRYAAGDPVEALVSRALMLDAAPAPAPQSGAVRALRLDRAALDEAELGALFGLLVSAHYRTTPNDLLRLLDAPGARIWSLRRAGVCVGAALLRVEGGLPEALCAEMYEGRRRPQGHMLPATLCAHAGLESAPRRVGHRVVRIAIHPALRRQGLGHRLLGEILRAARDEGADYVGAAFGVTPPLLAFWRGAGFGIARVGARRGRSTAERSAVVLRPLSEAGRALAEAARGRWAALLPHLLSDALRDTDAALARALAEELGPSSWRPDDEAVREILSVARGTRPMETALPALWALSWAAARDPSAATVLDEAGWALVFRRLIQRRTLRLTGAERATLRDALWRLVLHLAPEATARLAPRYAP